MTTADLYSEQKSNYNRSTVSVSGYLDAAQVVKLLPNLDRPLVRQAHRQGLGLIHAAMRILDQQCRSITLMGLLRLGADINAHNNDQDSPLHEVVDRFDLDGLNELIAMGADVDNLNGWGQTPLHVTARNGRVRPAIRLIDAGANLYLKDAQGRTFLEVGNISFVEHIELLLDVRKTICVLDVRLIALGVDSPDEID